MYRLHSFSTSGNCFKVAFLLRALEQPFETVFVDYMGGMTREPGWRAETNEMGEVPVLEDGLRRLTQSGVILTYLAEKHGAYGGRDEDERREVLRWLFFDNHKFTSYFATYRFLRSWSPTPPDPTILSWLKSRFEGAFGVVDKHLAAQPFLVGSEPTIADFSLSAYLFYPQEESGYDVAGRFPSIGAWVERMKALPAWASPYEVLPGARIPPRW